MVATKEAAEVVEESAEATVIMVAMVVRVAQKEVGIVQNM